MGLSLEDLRKEKVGEKHKLTEFILIYDQPNIPVEAFYFWLLDFLRDSLKLKVDKLSDFYEASAGSGFLGEMGQRMAVLLDRGRQLGELINTIIKGILSIIYELKYIESRIKLYNDIKSNNTEVAETAFKALKSIWVDNVDSQRGGASLINLRNRLGFATVYDIFMVYEDEEGINLLARKGVISKELVEKFKNEKRWLKKLEEEKVVNKKVLSIVASRIREFYNWIEISEKEIRHRYNILKSYLKSQINALMVYFEFAKPYFRLARKLLMKDFKAPDIVSIFETAMLELDLIATGKSTEVEEFDEKEEKFVKRKYVPVYEVHMILRMAPTAQRLQLSTVYTHIGRIDFHFRSYLLQEEELEEIRREEEVKDLMYLQGMTEDTLKELAAPIFSIFLFDEIQNNPKIKEKVAKVLGTKPEEIKKPEDIKWSKEIIDIIKNEKPELLRGIEWIAKYLPKNESQNKEENKKNESNESKKSSSISFIFPFKEIVESLADVLHFLLIIPRKFSEEKLKLEKKIKKEKAEEILNQAKSDAKDLAWTIYETFKKNFRLLTW